MPNCIFTIGNCIYTHTRLLCSFWLLYAYMRLFNCSVAKSRNCKIIHLVTLLRVQVMPRELIRCPDDRAIFENIHVSYALPHLVESESSWLLGHSRLADSLRATFAEISGYASNNETLFFFVLSFTFFLTPNGRNCDTEITRCRLPGKLLI